MIGKCALRMHLSRAVFVWLVATAMVLQTSFAYDGHSSFAVKREVIVVGQEVDRVEEMARRLRMDGLNVRTYPAPNMNRAVNPNAYGSSESLDANWHFARQHGLNYTTFCGWRQRQTKLPPSPAFVEVEVAAPAAAVELWIELGAHARLRLTSAAQVELAARFLHHFHALAAC